MQSKKESVGKSVIRCLLEGRMKEMLFFLNAIVYNENDENILHIRNYKKKTYKIIDSLKYYNKNSLNHFRLKNPQSLKE